MSAIVRGGVVASLMLAGAAHGADLRFDIVYGSDSPGITETFDIDTSQVGTPSVAEGMGQEYDDFVITDDTLGYTLLQVGDLSAENYFATADNDYDAAFDDFLPSTYLTTVIYSSMTQTILAHAGETFAAIDGAYISVSAATPEPSAWALMLVGVGVCGVALRRRRTRLVRDRAAVPIRR